MTDYQKLLSEARLKIEHYAAYREEQKLDTNHEADLLSRIDAALAEPVEPVAIGEVKESGVVWANQNPHAYPIGTKFYTAPADQDRVDAERLDWLERNVSAIRDIGWINGPLRDAIDRARSAK